MRRLDPKESVKLTLTRISRAWEYTAETWEKLFRNEVKTNAVERWHDPNNRIVIKDGLLYELEANEIEESNEIVIKVENGTTSNTDRGEAGHEQAIKRTKGRRKA